jgi:hypothetical protein
MELGVDTASDPGVDQGVGVALSGSRTSISTSVAGRGRGHGDGVDDWLTCYCGAKQDVGARQDVAVPVTSRGKLPWPLS